VQGRRAQPWVKAKEGQEGSEGVDDDLANKGVRCRL
jgi:hypothetical protein